MSTLREAAQQALEALNSIDVGYRSPSGDPLEVSFDEVKCEAAAAALRAALAQQDEPTIDEYPLWSGMPPPEPRIHYEGPVTFHTQRCAVLPGQHAVLQMNTGVFHPSWAAQEQGWRLVCADTWLRKLALRLFGDA